MGYYTKYELDIDGEVENWVTGRTLDGQLVTVNTGVSIDTVKREIVALCGTYPFYDACKWYNHSEHMIQVSKKYPDAVFILSGEGEESGDLWKKYYKNGREQLAKAKITYDECKL